MAAGSVRCDSRGDGRRDAIAQVINRFHDAAAPPGRENSAVDQSDGADDRPETPPVADGPYAVIGRWTENPIRISLRTLRCCSAKRRRPRATSADFSLQIFCGRAASADAADHRLQVLAELRAEFGVLHAVFDGRGQIADLAAAVIAPAFEFVGQHLLFEQQRRDRVGELDPLPAPRGVFSSSSKMRGVRM